MLNLGREDDTQLMRFELPELEAQLRGLIVAGVPRTRVLRHPRLDCGGRLALVASAWGAKGAVVIVAIVVAGYA